MLAMHTHMASAASPTQPANTAGLLVVTIASSLWLAACHGERARPPTGDILADLAMPTVAGTTFDPEPLYRRKVLVMFFSPMCGHCVKELPVAVAAAKQAGGAALAVMVSGSSEQAIQLDAVESLAAPVIIDDGRLRSRYAIAAVPYTLILDGDGHAQRAFVGAQGQERLARALREVHP